MRSPVYSWIDLTAVIDAEQPCNSGDPNGVILKHFSSPGTELQFEDLI